ncbi:hypothetical protein C6P42_001717 [Pichia californica]|nr:hypothetical protein C6P42_001717 [[Candida] californica]
MISSTCRTFPLPSTAKNEYIKILTCKRFITRKSLIKRKDKDTAVGSTSKNNTGIVVSAQGKAILKMKKDNTKAKETFIHDYSVFPETLQYRLPNENEKGKEPEPHSNLVKVIFEQGGVESMDLNKNEEKFSRYPVTNPTKLNKRNIRPSSVKMLTGDFIDDSLYNVNCGYFSKEAVIFQPDRPFDYNHLEGKDEFMQKWLEAYDKYDKEQTKTALQVIQRPNKNTNDKTNSNSKPKQETKTKDKINERDEEHKIVKPSLQLWHTPTELFQPFYGEALARYILVNYKLKSFPYDDLVIYEAGAGNGTLMLNILDFLEKNEPEVYARTKYRIIEISSKLFNKQNSRLERHKDKVEVINKSILEWNTLVNEPCFFIALEVFDNLSHDVVRYDIDTKQPYQGYVVIDEHNDFQEYHSPNLDELTKEFLKLREEGNFPIKKLSGHPLNQFYPYMKLRNMLNPLRNNLSEPEYIPTRLFKLFKILKEYFPKHQILASDFSYFDKTIKGYNSPTVQTMYLDNMVNTDTYMVEQGYFDIMFPTDFRGINELYRQVTQNKSSTCSHAEFLKKWAEVEKTRTKKTNCRSYPSVHPLDGLNEMCLLNNLQRQYAYKQQQYEKKQLQKLNQPELKLHQDKKNYYIILSKKVNNTNYQYINRFNGYSIKNLNHSIVIRSTKDNYYKTIDLPSNVDTNADFNYTVSNDGYRVIVNIPKRIARPTFGFSSIQNLCLADIFNDSIQTNNINNNNNNNIKVRIPISDDNDFSTTDDDESASDIENEEINEEINKGTNEGTNEDKIKLKDQSQTLDLPSKMIVLNEQDNNRLVDSENEKTESYKDETVDLMRNYNTTKRNTVFLPNTVIENINNSMEVDESSVPVTRTKSPTLEEVIDAEFL